MEYYIISVKHTSKGDTALTLWGKNHSGYVWNKENAGIYTEKDREAFRNDQDNIFVSKEEADKLFLHGNDFGDKYVSLPNDITTRLRLGVSDQFMKPKKYAASKIKFHLS